MEWLLSNGNIHYTYLAIQEGYSVNFDNPDRITYSNPNGDIVATSTDIWEQLIIPTVLADYTERKRDEIDNQFEYSFVVGFDYYHYTKDFWVHSWGNIYALSHLILNLNIVIINLIITNNGLILMVV